jgi:hypothetical protein
MRNHTRTLLAAVAITAIAGVAYADSPHFVKGPTGGIDATNGDYTATWKEAGLGNNQLITYDLSAENAIFTWRCFNKGSNQPQGDPNTGGTANLTTSGTFPSGKNGQITGSLSLVPQQGTASCQGNGLKLCLLHAEYDNVTFFEETNNLGPISLGSASADFPAPSKQNHGACIEPQS